MTAVNWESAAANTIIQIIPHLRNGSEITEKLNILYTMNFSHLLISCIPNLRKNIKSNNIENMS